MPERSGVPMSLCRQMTLVSCQISWMCDLFQRGTQWEPKVVLLLIFILICILIFYHKDLCVLLTTICRAVDTLTVRLATHRLPPCIAQQLWANGGADSGHKTSQPSTKLSPAKPELSGGGQTPLTHLTHSLTHSPTHSHSLPPTLTRSLTHSLTQ